MTVATAAIAAIIIVAYVTACAAAVWLGTEGEQPFAALVIAVVLVALLLFGIGKLIENSDNSVHCGSGTVYRESSRYDPATKQVRHDWVCEAN